MVVVRFYMHMLCFTLRVKTRSRTPNTKQKTIISRGAVTSREVRSYPLSHFRGKTRRVQPPLQRRVEWARCAPAPTNAKPRSTMGTNPKHTPNKPAIMQLYTQPKPGHGPGGRRGLPHWLYVVTKPQSQSLNSITQTLAVCCPRSGVV